MCFARSTQSISLNAARRHTSHLLLHGDSSSKQVDMQRFGTCSDIRKESTPGRTPNVSRKSQETPQQSRCHFWPVIHHAETLWQRETRSRNSKTENSVVFSWTATMLPADPQHPLLIACSAIARASVWKCVPNSDLRTANGYESTEQFCRPYETLLLLY